MDRAHFDRCDIDAVDVYGAASHPGGELSSLGCSFHEICVRAQISSVLSSQVCVCVHHGSAARVAKAEASGLHGGTLPPIQ